MKALLPALTLALVAPALSACRATSLAERETEDAPAGAPGAAEQPLVETVSASSRPVDAATRAAIEAELARMERAFAGGDLEAVAATYADDALLLGPGGTRITGRAAIDAYWARFDERADPWAPGERAWTLTARDFGGGDDLAWHLGRSTLVVHRAGVRTISTVDYALVWRRGADGRWRIVVDAYR